MNGISNLVEERKINLKQLINNEFELENRFRLIAIIIFLIASLYFFYQKLYLPSAVCLIAGSSYIAMYLNTSQENIEKFRYIDWIVTTPIMLFAILNYAKVPLSKIFLLLIIDIIMIYTGYLSKTEKDPKKKNIWVIYGGILYLFIAYALYMTKSPVAIFTLILWTSYPVVFILNQYGYLTDTIENEIVTVIDVISKVGFGLLLV